MKFFYKILIAGSIVLNGIFIALLVQPVVEPIASKITKPSVRVAISTPVSHPSLEKIEDGFRGILTAGGSDSTRVVTTFNGNGDKALIRAQIEEIMHGDYDLVFTIGTLCSQVATELAKKKGKDIPIVFGAVSDPIEAGIVDSLEAGRNTQVTGTTEPRNHKQFVDILTYLLPDARTVGIVYNPSQDPQLENDKKETAQLLSRKGIELKATEAYNSADVRVRAAALIDPIDELGILKDSTIVSEL